jgi:hypothetical protein
MITNFNKYQLITEDPDHIEDKSNRITLNYKDSEAIPFSCDISSNGKKIYNIFFGRSGQSHDNITKNEKGERAYPGRLWLNSKVIAFWVYPDDEMFKMIIKRIEEKRNIQIFNNGWRMEVQKRRGKIKKKKFKKYDEYYLNDGGYENAKLIPIEEYAGSPDVPQEQLMMHLMKWQDKEKLKKSGKMKNWGSDKTSWDAPKNLPYRQTIYQENKKEQ